MGQLFLRRISCPPGHYKVCALQQAQQGYRITEDEITETCGLAGKHGTEEVILQKSAHKWSSSAEPTLANGALKRCCTDKDSKRFQETQ
jgi:hypothetical protein